MSNCLPMNVIILCFQYADVIVYYAKFKYDINFLSFSQIIELSPQIKKIFLIFYNNNMRDIK